MDADINKGNFKIEKNHILIKSVGISKVRT